MRKFFWINIAFEMNKVEQKKNPTKPRKRKLAEYSGIPVKNLRRILR